MKMTIGDAIRLAMDTGSAAGAGRIADQLRARGWTYQRIVEAVEAAGRSPLVWETLMYDADTEESLR